MEECYSTSGDSSTGKGAATTTSSSSFPPSPPSINSNDGETNKRKSSSGGDGEPTRKYRGVRMRKWGKWVAELREPNKRSRLWLGSYSSPVAAARAYDTAMFCLRGHAARLNFPEELRPEDVDCESTSTSIRRKAIEVGTRVDAARHHHVGCTRGVDPPRLDQKEEGKDKSEDVYSGASCKNPDLNLEPCNHDEDVDDDD